MAIQGYFASRNFKQADAVIAPSREIAFLEAGYFKIHPDRFFILPHVFNLNAEKGFHIPSGPTHDDYFLVVGNIEYLKGFDLLVEGFRRYRRLGGKARLLVAGTTGPPDPNPQVASMLGSPAFQAAVRELDKDAIVFLGRLDKNRLAYIRARSTAVVIASRFEAFTMVAGEAFLTGCPVILSDRTGWTSLARSFQAARLYDPYDADDLSAAMADMNDSVRRAQYQKNALALARYICSADLAEKTARYYRDVALGRGVTCR